VGHEFLNRWIGKKIGSEAFLPFSILLLGVFVNSFAYIPFALIMAAGRSRFSAIVHLIELPVFLVLLYIFVRPYGATGAAIAWTLRVTVDAGGMFLGGVAILPGLRTAWRKDLVWIMGTAVVMLITCFPIGTASRSGIDLGWLALWTWAYHVDLRSRIVQLWGAVRLRLG
jgi:O-antigen/teichoic acid export membrane protein